VQGGTGCRVPRAAAGRTMCGSGRSRRRRPGRRSSRRCGCTSSSTSATLAPGSSTRTVSSCARRAGSLPYPNPADPTRARARACSPARSSALRGRGGRVATGDAARGAALRARALGCDAPGGGRPAASPQAQPRSTSAPHTSACRGVTCRSSPAPQSTCTCVATQEDAPLRARGPAPRRWGGQSWRPAPSGAHAAPAARCCSAPCRRSRRRAQGGWSRRAAGRPPRRLAGARVGVRERSLATSAHGGGAPAHVRRQAGLQRARTGAHLGHARRRSRGARRPGVRPVRWAPERRGRRPAARSRPGSARRAGRSRAWP